MALLDLSVPIETGMPVYPGDPEVSIGPALTVARDGVNVLGLHLGSHSGTHVDAPYHLDGSLPTLDELPLERFHGPAAVVDAMGRAPGSPIGPELFEHVSPGVIVLVATGWPFGSQDHPFLSAEAASLLVERGVRTVGIDALSVDPTPADAFPAHEALLRAHAVIAENLCGLDRLIGQREVEVSMFPLRIAGGDGSPVRAVARVG
ncbi:cyclase family protein [Nonomuraea rubra]|uniref:Kynurenine formamidase n=1 Tax=Nonomuraea rubra TaxID=46180 RepID=A0A7X0P3S3_9ACTN|nr:cyclase family protein [Nonomuraea rubra]MBB6554741.1 kynurenine formamidase [Nonomuraea rubra]